MKILGKVLSVALVFIFLGSTACSDNKTKQEKAIAKKMEQEGTNSLKDKTFTDLVEAWSQAHSLDNINQFNQLFDNTVLFYGSELSRNECLFKKRSLLDKHHDFKQIIVSDIEVKKYESEQYLCFFIKRVTIGVKTTDYPSYLMFRKYENDWKIVVESDEVTDRNLAKRIPKNAIKGDFNGDEILEYAWLVPPKINYEDMDCVGECNSYIKFSDPKIPAIKIENCIGGSPNNLGDLNKDGADEIGLLPGWFTSCWRPYYVWTLKNSQWIYAVEPIITHCDQWDEGVIPIEIDLNKNGFVLIRFSESTDDGLVTKAKSVPIK